MTELAAFLGPIRRIHAQIRDAVVRAFDAAADDTLAQVDREAPGDTIYAVDRLSEDRILDLFERELAEPLAPLLLVAEGLEQGPVVLPRGASPQDARWRIIVDPIDGTRGLMYQKRSAWILTGVAPNRGPRTDLRDIVVAVQTEIPTAKQHLSDTLWAVSGEGAHGERFDRIAGVAKPFEPKPSKATSIAHGFAMIARFFPGAREELAAIDEEVVRAVLGPVQPGRAHCFEDQYICTGGQLYELMAGHDRFVADLRPLLERHLQARGLRLGICCHPYDLATELIAREAGVIVTAPGGGALSAPLDVTTDLAWVGYANPAIRAQVEPALESALKRRGLLP